jgi:hypothetical protein
MPVDRAREIHRLIDIPDNGAASDARNRNGVSGTGRRLVANRRLNVAASQGLNRVRLPRVLTVWRSAQGQG